MHAGMTCPPRKRSARCERPRGPRGPEKEVSMPSAGGWPRASRLRFMRAGRDDRPARGFSGRSLTQAARCSRRSISLPGSASLPNTDERPGARNRVVRWMPRALAVPSWPQPQASGGREAGPDPSRRRWAGRAFPFSAYSSESSSGEPARAMHNFDWLHEHENDPADLERSSVRSSRSSRTPSSPRSTTSTSSRRWWR